MNAIVVFGRRLIDAGRTPSGGRSAAVLCICCGLAGALLLPTMVDACEQERGVPFDPLAIDLSRSSGSGLARLEMPPENPEDPPGIRPDTVDVQTTIGDSTMVLRFGPDSLVVPYFANHHLDQPLTGITRAVVVVHGTLRNADDYYHSIEHAAGQVPGADSTCFLIAPQFLTEADLTEHELPDSYLFWAYMGWRQGDRSLDTAEHPRPVRISAFAVLDSLLRRLAEGNPDLLGVVVAGHSAGGQFVNRYAAGTRMVEPLALEHGIAMRFVVSNPSGYLYFDPRRWVPGSEELYALPEAGEIATCPGYDDYKYGLQNPNEYMDQGPETLRTQYADREVVYLLGADDNNPNSAYLERNCEAMLQGEHRLQRGLLYRGHLASVFGPELLDAQPFAVIPGVGHDHRAVFNSACGFHYLFDYAFCLPNLPTAEWLDRTTVPLRAPAARSCAWEDFDRDGDPDLFLGAFDASDRLLRNDNALFHDVTPSVLHDPQHGICAKWADTDRDGDPDLHVLNWEGASRHFRNEGGGIFIDETEPPLDAGGRLTESSWADYDLDGDLDLYLTRTDGEANALLRNEGGNVFTDVTTPALADTSASQDGCWIDIDSDRDPDLLVVNTGAPERLFRNDGGEFLEVTPISLTDLAAGTSGSWGDYDGDGDLDLYLVNRAGPNRLLRNEGGADLRDVSDFPLNDGGNGRSACWGDYDNDGHLDLYLANSGGPNRLFRNQGDGSFFSVNAYPLNDAGLGTAAAWADYDGDGRLDLYLANSGNWGRLFQNRTAQGNHWFQVELLGTESNTAGIGARVRLWAGGRVQTREIGSEAGSVSQSWTVAAFGLGPFCSMVDSVEVRWPGGIVQVETMLPADQRIRMVESSLPSEMADPTSSGSSAGARPRIRPNPSRAGVLFEFSAPSAGTVHLEVFDAAGRRVHRLVAWSEAGPNRHLWDGLDSGGRPAGAGVYFLRLTLPGARHELPFVRLP